MGRKLRFAAVALAMAMLIVGCSDETPNEPTANAETTAAATTTTAQLTTEDPVDPVPTDMQYNALTGEYDIPKDSPTRWVAVMIGNNDASRPQYNVSQADMFIEGETEGGITRIMAVFGSVDRLPSTLGPVRSARTHFVTLAQALDVVYCHAGGSETALAKLERINIDNANALVHYGSAYWRDMALANSKGYEYSMMTGADELGTLINSLGYSSTQERAAPFTFGDTRGTDSGKRVQIDVTYYQTVNFVYDEEDGVYVKYNGTFENGERHDCEDGTPITASNVVVLYAPKYMENDVTCNFDLSAGQGILLSGGTSRSIEYTCSESGLTFTEENGSRVEMAKGKTYICLVDSARAGYTYVE